jgi:D-alanyl-D-alanine carboxypeptidase
MKRSRRRKKNKTAYFFIILCIVAVILIITPLVILKFNNGPGNETGQRREPVASIPSAFNNISIGATSAYVYDVAEKKVLYQKDADQSLPLASLTKIMTAVTAADIAPAGTVVTINRDDFIPDGDGTNGLYVDEKWNLLDLLKFTLVVSSDDGAAAVSEALGSPQNADGQTSRDDFVSMMNETAAKLGLREMQFNNETGLDVSATTAGAYGSAKDVSELLMYAMTHYPSIIDVTGDPTIAETSLSGLSHFGQNTDILSTNIPNLIASKTGYTDLAGGNLAVAFDAGLEHPIIVVVLDSTYDGRFADVNTLVQAAIKSVSNNTTPEQSPQQS